MGITSSSKGYIPFLFFSTVRVSGPCQCNSAWLRLGILPLLDLHHITVGNSLWRDDRIPSWGLVTPEVHFNPILGLPWLLGKFSDEVPFMYDIWRWCANLPRLCLLHSWWVASVPIQDIYQFMWDRWLHLVAIVGVFHFLFVLFFRDLYLLGPLFSFVFCIFFSCIIFLLSIFFFVIAQKYPSWSSNYCWEMQFLPIGCWTQ